MKSPTPTHCRYPKNGHARLSHRLEQRGFTIIELLVAIGVLLLLLAILIPAFNGVRQKARATECQSNLRSIGQLVGLYMNENDNYFPYAQPGHSASGAWNWSNYGYGPATLGEGWSGNFRGGELPYLAGYRPGPDGIMSPETFTNAKTRHLFRCPADTAGGHSYAANMLIMGRAGVSSSNPFARKMLVNLNYPGRLILIADNASDREEDPHNPPYFQNGAGYGGWERAIGFHRHGGRANVLYADLSVGAVTREQVTEKNIDPSIN
jgi:prepilin-type N-terminal cleavage/methylation domain-containing protein/prepilin-type processing-associated H-X9-DG protein